MVSILYANLKESLGMYVLFCICFLSLTGCTSSEDSTKSSLINSDDGKTSLQFSTFENGTQANWRVYFDEDKISALYHNGIRIPKDQIHNYEDMVFEKLDDLDDQRYEEDFSNSDIDIHIDMDELRRNMDKIAKELKENKINIHIDKMQFEKNMEKLKEELEKLKDLDMDIDINIDSEALKENMKELEKNLQNLRINNQNFPFNQEEFRKHLKEVTGKMRDEQYTINTNLKMNMNHLLNKMNHFNKDLECLEYDTDNLKAHLSKLDLFIKDIKKEFVKDGIIKSIEDDVEISFSSKGLEVNDVKVPDEVFAKCKSLYRIHFNKDISDDWNLDIHE